MEHQNSKTSKIKIRKRFDRCAQVHCGIHENPLNGSEAKETSVAMCQKAMYLAEII